MTALYHGRVSDITDTLQAFHEGALSWEDALARLSRHPFAPKPEVPKPTDAGADFARWWNEVDAAPFPVEGTYDEVVMARLLKWITPEQAGEILHAQMAMGSPS